MGGLDYHGLVDTMSWETLKTANGWVVSDLDVYALVRWAGKPFVYDTEGQAQDAADHLNRELAAMEATE